MLCEICACLARRAGWTRQTGSPTSRQRRRQAAPGAAIAADPAPRRRPGRRRPRGASSRSTSSGPPACCSTGGASPARTRPRPRWRWWTTCCTRSGTRPRSSCPAATARRCRGWARSACRIWPAQPPARARQSTSCWTTASAAAVTDLPPQIALPPLLPPRPCEF